MTKSDAMADHPMRRVSIVGAPGSGKTTVGRRLAAHLDVPFIELDAIFHQAGWNDLPADEFRTRARDALSAENWVVDGNYSAVQDLVWRAADTVIWLDLPRHVVMRRVTLRTLRRAITRERLWNDNREPLTNFYRLNPMQNLIRWTWLKYPEYARRYGQAARDPANTHLHFIRLGSQVEIDDFVK
jgi:adenylate kinase family enzyme